MKLPERWNLKPMGVSHALMSMAFFLSLVSGSITGQDREKAVEVAVQKQLDPELLPAKPTSELSFAGADLLWDWGGFTGHYFINAADGSGVRRANRYEAHYLWARATYTEHLGMYTRVKNTKRETRRGDHHGGNHTDRDKIRLDVGYLSFNSGASDFLWSLQAGRYFVSHGSGISLLENLDGGRLDFSYGNFSGFVHRGRTPESRNNQNPAAPGSYNSKRYFNGIELGLSTVGGWRPYAGYLQERDNSEERPRNTNQEFRSDFNMVFAGLRGEITPQWKISGEHIWQTGRVPRLSTPSHRNPQSSNAYVISTQYLQDSVAIYEYDFTYARGDNDRRSVVASGNGSESRIGRSDHNFFYFGYVDTGLVYAPRISNMLIHHGGVTVNLPELPRWQAKLDLYNFRRDVSHTANSDPYITRHGSEMGREADVSLEFRPFANMSLVGDYGIFFAGRPHGTSSNSSPRREYFGVSLSLDF